jgi:hypothetical protein
MWDILNHFDNPGANAIFGLLAYFLCLVFIVITLVIVINLLKNIRSVKYFALFHVVVIILTILLFTWIPFTEVYQKLFFAAEHKQLTDTMQQYESGALISYTVGYDEYLAPYRLTSYTGKVYINKTGDVIRAVFTVYKGFGQQSVLLYSSSGEGINDAAYSFYLYGESLSDIKKLDTNWYAATVTY